MLDALQQISSLVAEEYFEDEPPAHDNPFLHLAGLSSIEVWTKLCGLEV
jgi:hypothetical protein